MARFLSSEWLDELALAVNENPALCKGSVGRRLVIQQIVTEGPEGESCYHVDVDDGTISIHPGKADAADVCFVTDYATAVAVNAGTDSAQAAFMRGRLRLGGSVAALIRNADLLALVDDVFAPVRARTSY